jgi:hypothetical protein
LPIKYSDVTRNFSRISTIYNVNYIFGNEYFNDKYELDIVDQQGKNKVNFWERWTLFRNVRYFFSKIKKIIPIVKPDISRLLGAESIQPEEYLVIL